MFMGGHLLGDALTVKSQLRGAAAFIIWLHAELGLDASLVVSEVEVEVNFMNEIGGRLVILPEDGLHSARCVMHNTSGSPSASLDDMELFRPMI